MCDKCISKEHCADKYYYRFGELPRDGKSAIWQGDKCVGYEEGVSVYEVHLNNNGEYVPVVPCPLTEKGLNDYVYHLNYFRGRKYIVSGDILKKVGSNGEPILKNVKIIKEL